MSTTQTGSERGTQPPIAGMAEMKLEVVILSVADVDRAKRFYAGLGWRLDADFATDDGIRVVQLTPPGSLCSIQFGKGLTPAAPGSAQGLYLVVPNLEEARAELIRHGAEVSPVFHFAGIRGPRLPGPDPDGRSYRSWASFSDPDGNGWLMQEVTERLPGRVGPEGIAFDVAALTELLQETEKHHGPYEATAPKHHWSGWYAAYIVARLRGKASEEAAEEAALHIEGTLH